MPVALPFILEGLKYLLLAGLGYVTVKYFTWTLSKGKGWITWANIKTWAETNIKSVAEWVWSDTKKGLKDVATTLNRFKDSFKYYVQDVDASIRATSTGLINYITTFVIPDIVKNTKAIANIPDYISAKISNIFDKITNYINSNIMPTIYSVTTTFEDFVKYVEDKFTATYNWTKDYIKTYVLPDINSLLSWKQKVSTWIYNLENIRIPTIEKNISDTSNKLNDTISNTDERIKDLLDKLEKTGLAAIAGTTALSWITDLEENVFKKHVKDVENLENYDIDWLLVAYLTVISPVLIEHSDDIISTLNKGFRSIIPEVVKGE